MNVTDASKCRHFFQAQRYTWIIRGLVWLLQKRWGWRPLRGLHCRPPDGQCSVGVEFGISLFSWIAFTWDHQICLIHACDDLNLSSNWSLSRRRSWLASFFLFFFDEVASRVLPPVINPPSVFFPFSLFMLPWPPLWLCLGLSFVLTFLIKCEPIFKKKTNKKTF